MASSANQKFILQNIQADVSSLLLKHHNNEEFRFLVQQIAARQRIRKKLPEWYENPKLLLPPTLNLEQSSSAETAQLKASFFEGNQFTDLTGGLGVDFYYIGRKFANRTYVEPNPELYQTAVYNFGLLNFSGQFLNLSAEEALPQLKGQDLIYLDPSRRSKEKARVIKLDEYTPNAIDLQGQLLKSAKEVLIKTSPMYALEEGVKNFEGLSEIWILSLRNDCKELLFRLGAKADEVKLKTWNLLPENQQFFEANYKNRQHAVEYAEANNFIYEPNASILKAGLAEALAMQLGLKKLHPNSHIYTSAGLIRNYPGKVFSLIAQHKPFTKSLRKKRFNVISRNFPEKASVIESQLSIKPARSAYLIATTSLQQKVFLEAELIF